MTDGSGKDEKILRPILVTEFGIATLEREEHCMYLLLVDYQYYTL